MTPCDGRDLKKMTCQIANTFKHYGITKGDRVAVYMPVSPLLVATMMACARIGAVHSVVFAGFSAEALKSRILDGKERMNTLILLIVGCYYLQQNARLWLQPTKALEVVK